MSGLTFNGSSTQEMINNAKGEEKKIKQKKKQKKKQNQMKRLDIVYT